MFKEPRRPAAAPSPQLGPASRLIAGGTQPPSGSCWPQRRTEEQIVRAAIAAQGREWREAALAETERGETEGCVWRSGLSSRASFLMPGLSQPPPPPDHVKWGGHTQVESRGYCWLESPLNYYAFIHAFVLLTHCSFFLPSLESWGELLGGGAAAAAAATAAGTQTPIKFTPT